MAATLDGACHREFFHRHAGKALLGVALLRCGRRDPLSSLDGEIRANQRCRATSRGAGSLRCSPYGSAECALLVGDASDACGKWNALCVASFRRALPLDIRARLAFGSTA